jgi:hypothetical protein
MTSLDAPEPPQIVLEQPSPCAASAEEALRRALDPAKAPGPAWKVALRVAADHGVLHASGEITDETGAPVAHRAMDGRECTGLARAIGVWASLVLDAEVERKKQVPPPPIPPPSQPAAELWPAPEPPEKPSPEAALFLAHSAEQRQIEVGLASYVMTGTGTGMIAGGSLFAVSEVGGGWFLRPALAAGWTFAEVVPTTHAYGTLGAGRFDACKRIPGNYLEKSGIQLDLCGGTDVGFLHVDAQNASSTGAKAEPAVTLGLFAVGPSIDLRGELGNELSVLVRGVAELNILSNSEANGTVSPSLLIARTEVGLSWRLR